jgi:hypothetical protein
MMTIAKVTLVALAALLIVTWLLCALGIVSARYRDNRALRAMGLGSPKVQLRDLYETPWLASLATVNVIWFVSALVWYRLRGRPLPPPPKPWRRG